jgi:hypothetical protein
VNKDYLNHWLIGLVATVVWLWGDRIGIPQAAVTYAATIVPTVVGHALAYTPASATDPNASAPQSGA